MTFNAPRILPSIYYVVSWTGQLFHFSLRRCAATISVMTSQQAIRRLYTSTHARIPALYPLGSESQLVPNISSYSFLWITLLFSPPPLKFRAHPRYSRCSGSL